MKNIVGHVYRAHECIASRLAYFSVAESPPPPAISGGIERDSRAHHPRVYVPSGPLDAHFGRPAALKLSAGCRCSKNSCITGTRRCETGIFKIRHGSALLVAAFGRNYVERQLFKRKRDVDAMLRDLLRDRCVTLFQASRQKKKKKALCAIEDK